MGYARTIKNIFFIYFHLGIADTDYYTVLSGMNLKYPKTLISLFDHSGNWSKPYADNGWNVIKVDIKNGLDIMDWDYGQFDYIRSHPKRTIKNVCGILAAIPCTDFALTGAASFVAKDADGRTAKSIELVNKTIEIINFYNEPAYQWDEELFWCVENPMTRMHKLVPELGNLKFRFSPNEFALYSEKPETNQYSKQTWLFGKFNNPIKNELPSLIDGLKWKDSKRGTIDQIKEQRSVTPDGFAKAFYLANNN